MNKRKYWTKLSPLVIFIAMSASFSLHAENKGEQLFMQNCMVCHSDDGAGAMPGISDLTESLSWSTISDYQLLSRLKTGIQKSGESVSMPPKGGNPELTDDDLKKVITFMRREFLK